MNECGFIRCQCMRLMNVYDFLLYRSVQLYINVCAPLYKFAGLCQGMRIWGVSESLEILYGGPRDQSG